MTIEQATDVWLSRYSSANTRAAYSSDLRAFLSWFGDLAAAMGATTDDLTQYRGERESHGISPATVDRQFAALRAFYDAAHELGLCADNPLGSRPQAVAATSATGTLTPAEVARLYDAAAARSANGRARATAARRRHAPRRDPRPRPRRRVRSAPRQAAAHRSPWRRGAVSCSIVRGRVRSAISSGRQSARGRCSSGRPRGRAGSTRLTRFGADHLIKQAATAAGIERPVSANVLRRTHVTTAQRAGVPIDDIRHTMGHIGRANHPALSQRRDRSRTPS